MDDQKNIKPDFSKAGEDSILYKKEEPKTEREKLKELHGKDKIWYLVHYYGLQTIVALAIIGIISFLIIHYVTQKDTALEIMAVNAIQSADNPAGDSGYYNGFLKENDLVYVKSTETGKKYPIGIKLEKNAWVKETGWYPDTCVVGLAEGLKNKDLAVKFIEENILED